MSLSPEQLEDFEQQGYLVIEDVFSAQEVKQLRDAFHAQLATLGVDHANVLAGSSSMPDGPRLKGVASNIFWAKWKLDAHLDPRVYNYTNQLLTHTFGSGSKVGYEHPFGSFQDSLAYVDRVCYRTPDCVRPEAGLLLHVDRNPTDPYRNLKKWRPIQALLTLTDHYGSESGGLQVVPGFHRLDVEYFRGKIFEGDGEFCRLNSQAHTALNKRVQTVQAPKGSLVFWDNRLPHATCQKLTGTDTREVIYLGYLPDVALNRVYSAQQAQSAKSNLPPPAYMKDKVSRADRDWEVSDLTPLQRRLLGL